MSYKTDLEQRIRESYKLIKEYEEILRLSSDPKEQARVRHATEEQWRLIRGYFEEYIPLCQRLDVRIANDLVEIMIHFPQFTAGDLNEQRNDNQQYNFAVIRQMLLAAFTTEALRRLSFDTPSFKLVYSEFSPGMGKTDLVDRILEFSETQLLMPQLLQAVKEHNPRQYARFEAKLYLDQQGVKADDDDR